MLQVQMLIRHDDDFRGALTLYSLKTLPLFILQQPDDCGVGTNDASRRLRAAADPTNIAEYFIGHRGRGFRIAPPFAIMTGSESERRRSSRTLSREISISPRSVTLDTLVRLSVDIAEQPCSYTLSRFFSRSMSMKSTMMIPPIPRNFI